MTKGQIIAVLSSDLDAFTLAAESLRERHLTAQRLAQVSVGERDDDYYITLIRTSTDAASRFPVEAVFGNQSNLGQMRVLPLPNEGIVTFPWSAGAGPQYQTRRHP